MMKSLNKQEKLKEILQNYKTAIGYTFLAGEVDCFKKLLSVHIFAKTIILPHNKNSNPFTLASRCRKKCRDSTPCVLIPGRAFDIWGTRHGRGDGWYDRFLSHIPKNWIRIGITDPAKLFFHQLVRQPWDEPVDWILIFDQSTSAWKACETRARPNYKF